MSRIYAKHLPYTDGHLAKVAAEMELAVAPTIRAVEYNGKLFALEGSHRLYLAHELGLLAPKIIVLESDISAGCEAFFDKIKDSLPVYDFPEILVLYERSFSHEL